MELEGRYFDGTSLEPKHVSLQITYTQVFIRHAGHVIATHMVRDMELLFADRTGFRIDLGVKGLPDVRIMLESYGLRFKLKEYLPQVMQTVGDDSLASAVKISAYLAIGVIILGVLLWQFEKVAYKLIPESTEVAFGESLVDGLVDDFGGYCRTESGQAALNKMLARLQNASPHYQSAAITVSVADSKVENAFALPGGQLVLLRGLLQNAESAEEVAGVLAHEMGHSRHRHALRGLVRAVGLSIFSIMFSGSDVSQLSQQMVFLAYSRSMETEADEEAAMLLEAAGLSSLPLAGFFDRHTGGGFGSYLSTHPDGEDRKLFLENADTGTVTPVLTDQEWDDLKAVCGEPPAADTAA